MNEQEKIKEIIEKIEAKIKALEKEKEGVYSDSALIQGTILGLKEALLIINLEKDKPDIN